MMTDKQVLDGLKTIRDYVFNIEENLAGHLDSDVCYIIDALVTNEERKNLK